MRERIVGGFGGPPSGCLMTSVAGVSEGAWTGLDQLRIRVIGDSELDVVTRPAEIVVSHRAQGSCGLPGRGSPDRLGRGFGNILARTRVTDKICFTTFRPYGQVVWVGPRP